MPNPPDWFGEAVGSLTPDALAGFVAEIWRARGLEVQQEGVVLHVEGGPDGRRVLGVVGSDGSVPDGIDTIVITDPEIDHTVDYDVIRPGDLFEQVRYALPSDESDRLVQTHLGVDPDEVGVTAPSESDAPDSKPAPTKPVDEATVAGQSQESHVESSGADTTTVEEASGQSGPHSRLNRRSVLVGAGGFVAGLGVAAAGWLGPFGPAGGAPAENDTSGTPTPRPEPVVAVPGLSPDGVSDSAVLADAHLRRLDASSYTVSSTQTVHRADGSMLASLGITTRVTDDRRMHVELATAGRASPAVFGEPPIQATLYSDGEQQFRRFISDEGTDYDVVALGAEVNGWFYWANIFPFGSLFISAIGYLRELFGAVPVSLTSRAGDGEPPYTLHATGIDVEPLPQVFDDLASDSPAQNLDLLASVTGAGLVSSLGLEFEGRRFEESVSVGVSYDYRQIGGTSVEAPDWIDRTTQDSTGESLISEPGRF